MKILSCLVAVTLWVVVCQAEPPTELSPAGNRPVTAPPATSTNESANYIISVQWKDTKLGSSFVQMMTAEGPFTDTDSITSG